MTLRGALGLCLTLHALSAPVVAQQRPQTEALFYATDAANAIASFEQHAKHVSVIAPQSYRIDARGNLAGTVPPAILDVARRNNVRIMPLIINPGWNLELFSTLVNDSSARGHMIAQMIELGKRFGYSGWQFDFEQIHVRDRAALTRMVRETANALHAAGLQVSIAIYPDPDPGVSEATSSYHKWVREYFSGAYDLKALADASDFISLMTYLQHGPDTAPGPVGGLPYMTRVVEHALALGIAPQKLSLGIPLFSMHWSTQWTEQKKAHGTARGLGWVAAKKLVDDANALLNWDAAQGSSYARWENSGMLEHAWIEDARAFVAKLELQRRYRLRGISSWRIGQEDPDIWDALGR